MPWCPTCRDEYRDGFTTCSECGAALVASLDEEPPAPEETGAGTHGGWDTVFESATTFEAELVSLRLRDAGFEAQVVDRTFTEAPMPKVSNINTVEVLVPTADVERARELLAQPVELAEDEEVPGTEPETPADEE
jgi:hypothetical protein